MTLIIDSELFKEQVPKILCGSVISISYKQTKPGYQISIHMAGESWKYEQKSLNWKRLIFQKYKCISQ